VEQGISPEKVQLITLRLQVNFENARDFRAGSKKYEREGFRRAFPRVTGGRRGARADVAEPGTVTTQIMGEGDAPGRSPSYVGEARPLIGAMALG
jgi:hypothetical protein